MPRATVVAVGQRWGRLSVIAEGPRIIRKSGNLRQWVCECDCGAEVLTRTNYLTSGDTRSCGCLNADIARKRNRTHGRSKTPLYRVWNGMRNRCQKESDGAWLNYGGRGISVCDAWSQSFETFEAWAYATGYRRGLSIDRINNDGDYEPGNCRWATTAEQALNTRANVHITAWGETKVLAEWARDPRCNVAGYSSISNRLNRGVSPEEAISRPGRKQKVNA